LPPPLSIIDTLSTAERTFRFRFAAIFTPDDASATPAPFCYDSRERRHFTPFSHIIFAGHFRFHFDCSLPPAMPPIRFRHAEIFANAFITPRCRRHAILPPISPPFRRHYAYATRRHAFHAFDICFSHYAFSPFQPLVFDIIELFAAIADAADFRWLLIAFIDFRHTPFSADTPLSYFSAVFI
jgi:hypothetical protein